jgi:hypothetical protein
MRFQQVIAVVARNVVVATVREIEAARAFVGAYRLHRWLHRMPLGSPNHLRDWMSPDDFAALIGCDDSRSLAAGIVDQLDHMSPTMMSNLGVTQGDKRGDQTGQPRLALVSCPVRSSRG